MNSRLEQARDVARELKEKFNTNDIEEIADMLVFVQEGDLVDREGMTFKVNEYPVIITDKKLSQQKKLFVLAHELGHVLLHPYKNQSHMKKYTAMSIDRDEQEANAFAFEALFGHLTANDFEDSYTIEEFIREYEFDDEVVDLLLYTLMY